METGTSPDSIKHGELLVPILGLQDALSGESSDNYRGQISIDRMMLKPVVDGYVEQFEETPDSAGNYELIYAQYLSELLASEESRPGANLIIEVTTVTKICARLLKNMDFSD